MSSFKRPLHFTSSFSLCMLPAHLGCRLKHRVQFKTVLKLPIGDNFHHDMSGREILPAHLGCRLKHRAQFKTVLKGMPLVPQSFKPAAYILSNVF